MKEILEAILYRGLEAFGRYYSIYRGYVVDNVDDQNQFRLKVKVPVIKGNKPLQNYAYPFGIYFGKGYGIKAIPNQGDLVWIQFEMGDISRPIWSYGHPLLKELPDELKGNLVGFKSPFGNYIIFSKDDIKINGGNNGGVVKVNPLVEDLNSIKNEINSLKTNLSTWSPVSGDGGAALKLLITDWAAEPLSDSNSSDLENPNLKH